MGICKCRPSELNPQPLISEPNRFLQSDSQERNNPGPDPPISQQEINQASSNKSLRIPVVVPSKRSSEEMFENRKGAGSQSMSRGSHKSMNGIEKGANSKLIDNNIQIGKKIICKRNKIKVQIGLDMSTRLIAIKTVEVGPRYSARGARPHRE